MDLGIAGRVALVTGASRGIGRAIADGLAAEGVRVARTAREPRDGAYPFDSDDLDAVGPLVDAVERDLGTIDIYVANTGGPPRHGDPLAIPTADWEAAHRTLVLSPMRFLARLVPGMRERGFGRVVVVSSSTAVEPIAGLQLSTAHRPGVMAAIKHLAHQTAADGVTLNVVLPGRIATDRLLSGYDSLEEAQRTAAAEVPAGRLGTPEELAAAAVFLCSQPASYVTGQALRVDGGLTRSV